MSVRLNELSLHVDPYEQVGGDPRARAAPGAVYVLKETVRIAVEGLPRIAAAFRVAAEAMRRVNEQHEQLTTRLHELDRAAK